FQSNRTLTSVQQQYMYKALNLTKSVWEKMVDIHDRLVPMTHDGYLKLYQMSQQDLSQRFGAILLDERQDVNPVIPNQVKIL
ncbi:DNA helicase, partial [Pseudomonas syringae pv. tagetis]